MGSGGGRAAAGVKGGAVVADGVNGGVAASASDGAVGCVEMDVGMVEPHVVSFEGV